MTGDSRQLWREASALHRAVFGGEIPDKIAERYVEAHRIVPSRIIMSDSAWMDRVVEAGADLEALEIVLRGRQPDHILCRKFKLLVYVAEAFPEYYGDFINEQRRPVRAWLSLSLYGFRTVCKYVKGRLVLRAWS